MESGQLRSRAPVAVTGLLYYLALAGLGYVANGYPIRLSNGADILTGTFFGLLAAVTGGMWAGLAVSMGGALRTYVMWGHPWAMPLIALEAAFVGWRARSNRTPVGSVLLYWTVPGVPLLVAIYRWHLSLSSDFVWMIGLADVLSGLLGAVGVHIFTSLAWPGRLPGGIRLPAMSYALRDHIWVSAMVFGIAPLLFLLEYAGGELAVTREREAEERLVNTAEEFAGLLEAGSSPGTELRGAKALGDGSYELRWRRRDETGEAAQTTVVVGAEDWIRRHTGQPLLRIYCFTRDGETVLQLPANRELEQETKRRILASAGTERTFSFRRAGPNAFQQNRQIAGRATRERAGVLVVAVQPASVAGSDARSMRKVALIWLSGTVLISLLLGAWFSRRITESLQQLVDSMQSALRQDGVLGECPAQAAPDVRVLWEGFLHLQAKLAAALAEQKRTAQTALAAVREKSAFMAAVSHEVRGPLNSILGSATLLQAENSSLDREEGLRIIQRSGRHLISIVEDVSDFSKLEAHTMTIRPSHFPLAAALADVLTWVEPEARPKNIELGLVMGADVPIEVYCDRTRLTQILFNLVQNAVKFTDRGRVRIEARRTGSGEGAVLEFRIEDTGDGIPAELQKRVFDPFYHRSSSLANPRAGSGLGLAIVRRLTEEMGGSVSLVSKEGEGTTVTVRLPAGRLADDKDRLRNLYGAEAVVAMGRSLSEESLVSQWRYLGLACRETVFDAEEMDWRGATLFVELDEIETDPEGLLRRCRAGGAENVVVVEAYGRRGDPPGLPREVDGMPVHLLRWPACVFQLPVAMQAILLSQGVTSAAPEGPGARRPLDILAAEDNPDSRLLLELALRKLGHTVVTASNGNEALEALRSRRFDVVVLDIEMPELNGLQALGVIRSNPATARLPVFALTAHTSEAHRREFLAAGFNGHIPKPYTLESLAEMLRSMGKRENGGGCGHGAVDGAVFGQYAELLQEAGQDVAVLVKRILSEVGEWLRTEPHAGEGGRTPHSLAGSCSLIGARKLAGLLRELSEMERTRETSKWNAKLAEAGEALRETEGFFAEEGLRTARE
jgi:signal transduction histidine kinase/CheY-like chemotaxis protein